VKLWIPPRRWRPHGPHPVGSPRTLYCSVGTRPPHSPRAARCVHLLITTASVAGFSTFGRLATATGFTRPNRVRNRWARAFALVACGDSPGSPPPDRSVSRRQLPSDARPELHAERAIRMADTSQSARTIWVTLAQPKKQRRTKTHGGRPELANQRPVASTAYGRRVVSRGVRDPKHVGHEGRALDLALLSTRPAHSAARPVLRASPFVSVPSC